MFVFNLASKLNYSTEDLVKELRDRGYDVKATDALTFDQAILFEKLLTDKKNETVAVLSAALSAVAAPAIGGNEVVLDDRKHDGKGKKTKVYVEEGVVFICDVYGTEISLDDYYSLTFDKLKELQGEKIIAVNAGRMNHGKSSLFNALANDKNMFASADVRCTKKCMRKEFFDGIDFIDTPGLDATELDDKEAFDAYKKADMIIFVHTPNIGELHRNEVEWIKKICDSYPSPAEFWKRFCFVFTFKEAIPDSEFKVIEEKVKEHILNYCGGKDYPVFKVSNSDYWDGMDTLDKELVELSGIGKLRQFLIKQSLKLKVCSQALRMERAKKIKDDSVNVLEEAKDEIAIVVSNKITEKNRVKEGLFKDLSDLIVSERTLGSL